MRLKAPDFVVDDDEPFKNDVLNRKESAVILTEIVESLDESFVLCIDAPWGQGKTTFLRMWRRHLENSGFVTLHFNAWENDFSDDAFISLIGEVSSGINARFEDKDHEALVGRLSNVKSLGAAIARRTIPVALKAATMGAFDAEGEVERALGEVAERVAGEQIERYEESKKGVENFRAELKEMAAEVSGERGELKPVVFVVDELDRCRPPYAIEVLEKVKHFFNVPGVVFVLAIDKVQMGHSVRSVYGGGMNVDGYLRRFFDLEYRFPSPQPMQYMLALVDCFGLASTPAWSEGDQDTLLRILVGLVPVYGLSLRDQERIFARLSVVIRSTPPREFLPIPLALFLVMEMERPEVYRGYMGGELDYTDVLSEIESNEGGGVFLATDAGAILEAWLVCLQFSDADKDKALERYRAQASDAEVSGSLRFRANKIRGGIESYYHIDGKRILADVQQGIDISRRFVFSELGG